MSQSKLDYMVLIGRFEPFHLGHKAVIDAALAVAHKVILCIGSVNQPRTIKNPWTLTERSSMIMGGMGEDKRDRILIAPVQDDMYSDQRWVSNVQNAVTNCIATAGWTDYPPRIGLTGHKKDESSYYLDLFPQWELIEHDLNGVISATDIRALYFEKDIHYIKSVVPQETYEYLCKFKTTEEFKTLQREHEFIKKYKQAWESAPYAPIFVTADAVVVQSGHVLLVVRDAAPGEGLLALPGGFVNQRERIVDAVIRELREETKIKVPAPVLRGSIVKSEVFDHPDRSLRGRTVTHAHLIELPPGPLPKVKGSDDARHAMWVPISEVREDNMFDDHYHIIRHLIG